MQVEYLGYIFRVTIYIGVFKAETPSSFTSGSIGINININDLTKETITVDYNPDEETDIYKDVLINIPIQPKDKVDISITKNFPSGENFIVDNIEVKLKCSKMPY